jgi:hypothetical protein
MHTVEQIMDGKFTSVVSEEEQEEEREDDDGKSEPPETCVGGNTFL